MDKIRSALRMLSIEDLGMLSALRAEGTLTKAATALGVTQSALSHRLAQLELRLGSSLFERHPRSMRPTQVGEHLTEAAGIALQGLNAALQMVESGEVKRLFRINIATECYTTYSWLPRVLKQYREIQSDVRISFVLEATRHPLEYLQDGRINLAVMSSPVRSDRFESLPLFRDEMMAVVAECHPWARKGFVNPDDFAKETLLAYSHAPGENTVVEEFLLPNGVTPARREEVSLTEALLELVAANMGVAAIANWTVGTNLEQRGLVRVKLGKTGMFRQWNAVVSKGALKHPHIKHFVKLAAKALHPQQS